MLWGMGEGSAGGVEVLMLIALVGAVAIGAVAVLAVAATFLSNAKRVRLAHEVEHPSNVPEPEYVPVGDESDWQAFVDQRVEGDEDREV